MSGGLEMWEGMQRSEDSPASGILQLGRGTHRGPSLLVRRSEGSHAGPPNLVPLTPALKGLFFPPGFAKSSFEALDFSLWMHALYNLPWSSPQKPAGELGRRCPEWLAVSWSLSPLSVSAWLL